MRKQRCPPAAAEEGRGLGAQLVRRLAQQREPPRPGSLLGFRWPPPGHLPSSTSWAVVPCRPLGEPSEGRPMRGLSLAPWRTRHRDGASPGHTASQQQSWGQNLGVLVPSPVLRPPHFLVLPKLGPSDSPRPRIRPLLQLARADGGARSWGSTGPKGEGPALAVALRGSP